MGEKDLTNVLKDEWMDGRQECRGYTRNVVPKGIRLSYTSKRAIRSECLELKETVRRLFVFFRPGSSSQVYSLGKTKGERERQGG